MGLLKRIEESINQKPYFSTFCKKYGFNHAGIYILQDNSFILSKSFGLDAETIFKSVSTKDFWEGTLNYKIDNDFWISFSRKEDNLEPFFQFFSKELVDSLNSIFYYIFKTSSATGIFFIVNEEEEYILPDLSENFTNELLFFIEQKTQYITNKPLCSEYNDEKNIPAEINFIELYYFYFEEVKYYPQKIQNLLMNSFYEQFYFNIKNILPYGTEIFPISNCKIHIILQKTEGFNKIDFTSHMNESLNIYCSKNFTIPVRMYFYTFNSIDSEDFFRSEV